MKVMASPMNGPGPVTFRHQEGPLGQAQVGFPPPSSRARGWQWGWPSAHLGSGLGDDTNPSCTLTHKKNLSGLGFPIYKTWQLPPTISESSHSNTAHLFVSLGPLGPPTAMTPSTVTKNDVGSQQQDPPSSCLRPSPPHQARSAEASLWPHVSFRPPLALTLS